MPEIPQCEHCGQPLVRREKTEEILTDLFDSAAWPLAEPKGEPGFEWYCANPKCSRYRGE